VLEALIETFTLHINNDMDEATRPKKSPGASIIDLTLTTVDIGALPTWGIERDMATGSDHELIVWGWECLDEDLGDVSAGDQIAAATENEVTGWDVKALGENPEVLVEAEQAWKGLAARRPGLTDEATPVDVEEEAIWVQETLTTVLNQHAKPVRVTVWSKRWWGKEIKENRRAFARVKRAWKEGSATEEEYKKARNEYYKGIRQAKRKC
jgi:hypothetical protein